MAAKKPNSYTHTLTVENQALDLKELVERCAGPYRDDILEGNQEYGNTGTLEDHIGGIIGRKREQLHKWYRAENIELKSLYLLVSGLNDRQGGNIKILVQFPGQYEDAWIEIDQFDGLKDQPRKRGRPKKGPLLLPAKPKEPEAKKTRNSKVPKPKKAKRK